MSIQIVPKTTLLLLFIVSCFVSPTLAAEPIEFKLAWDANQEEDLDGYEIYFREGYPGSNYRLIGDIYVDELADPDNPMATITDLYNGVLADPDAPVFRMNELEDNTKFYFALTAFDQEGNVSNYSRELCVEVSGSSVYECKAEDSVGGGGGGGCFITAAACEPQGVMGTLPASLLVGFILIRLIGLRKIFRRYVCNYICGE